MSLKENEEKYKYLFENNPQPLWIYDLETLAFLEVNQAAIDHYGYSKEEFLRMTLKDIRPKEDVNELIKDIATTSNELNKAGEWRHLKKNGEIIIVEIVSHTIDYGNRKARLVQPHDVTERKKAEEKLKMLSLAVEQNPASIIITDKHGNIEYVNSKFIQTSGYSSEELIGQNPRILNSGISSPDLYKNLWKTIQSGKQWTGYFHNRKKNGDCYTELATVMPINNKSGEITHYIAIKEDITEQLQSKKLIKTLGNAVEQSPTSIMITDADGKIEFVNSKFTSFMQYTLEEVKGKTPRIFNPGHTSEEIYESMWAKLRDKKVWQGEFVNRKKDKTRFFENVIISPLLDENGKVSNYILIMEDITEKKKMIEELVEAKEKAQESDRLKTSFLQNMSHEIRTPMNAIMGFSDLLPNVFNNAEKLRSYTSIIKERSAHLLDIINDILDIAKIESGRVQINLEECNLTALCYELEMFFNEYRERINKGHVNFTMDCCQLDRTIYIDQVKLKQILINLISNAFKFTHSGLISASCRLNDNNTLLFTVTDTGIGIPDDKKTEIFERFKQVTHDTSKFYEGTGLGLSIVKGILDIMGGEVWVKSEFGKGSIFEFTFPFEIEMKPRNK